MDEALLELIEKKDLAYITVKEICEKAGVNRSTFYLHYETVGDLLNESVQYMHSRFNEYVRPNRENIVARLRDCPEEDLYFITPEYLVPYLNFVKDNRRLLRAALENPSVLQSKETYDRMFFHVFTPILERYDVPNRDREYIMAFYVRGMMAIVSEWLKNDCADSVEYITKIMQQCVAQHEKRQNI